MNEEEFYKEACRRKLKEMRRNELNIRPTSYVHPTCPTEFFNDNHHIRINIEKTQHCFRYHQYDRLFTILQQVSLPVLLGILPHLSFDQMYESIPQTLPVLDVVFSRLLQAPSIDKSLLPWLQLDLLIPKLVLIFANGLLPTAKGQKNCNSYFPTSRNLLFAIFTLDPSLPDRLISNQESVKACIDQLASHSLVESTTGSLKSLPRALQNEFAADIQQRKQALQKLNDFCNKISVTDPSELSHQRLLQISEEEVEDRIFQNVTLLSIVEPTLKCESIKQLSQELQQRIESDKILLRKYKTLEKAVVSPSEEMQKEAVTVTLHKFLHGYATALELLEERKYQNSTPKNNQNRISESENNPTDIQNPTDNNIEESPMASDITKPFVTTAGRWPFDDAITQIGASFSSSPSSPHVNNASSFPSSPSSSSLITTNGKTQQLESSSKIQSKNEDQEKQVENSFNSSTTETHFGNTNNFSKKLPENKSKAVNYFIAAGRRVSKNYSRDRRRKRSTLDDLEELIAPDRNVGGEPANSGGVDGRQSNCDSFEEDSATFCSSQMDSISGFESEEKERLLQEVQNLKIELQHSRETICKLQAKEIQLKERLSEHAHKQFTMSNSRFEDLSLNEKRPTELIRLYGNLYSETRVDAADDLDNLAEISAYDKLKTKILFSVVVLAFRSTYESLLEMKSKVRDLLHIQVGNVNNENADLPSLSLEAEMDDYIRKTVDRHDCSPNVDDVCSQLYSALYDYPCLRQSKGLRQYIIECVRISWALNVQNPRYVISYDSSHFDPNLHNRFHTSESSNEEIQEFLWPALLEENGACVFKAVVIT